MRTTESANDGEDQAGRHGRLTIVGTLLNRFVISTANDDSEDDKTQVASNWRSDAAVSPLAAYGSRDSLITPRDGSRPLTIKATRMIISGRASVRPLRGDNAGQDVDDAAGDQVNREYSSTTPATTTTAKDSNQPEDSYGRSAGRDPAG